MILVVIVVIMILRTELMKKNETEESDVQAMLTTKFMLQKKENFIIDTACNKAHICKNPNFMLEKETPSSKRFSVHGITGNVIESDFVGSLPTKKHIVSQKQMQIFSAA